MNNPYVSIVVPFLNADRTLSKCIQSILAQTRKDWELILVDDGSTDESAEICLKYTESDKRVKLLKRPHEGVGPARNAAIEIAQGEKLCFVDADDTVEPDYLEGLCSHPEADMVVCGYFVDRYDKKGNLVSSESNTPQENTITTEEERIKLEDAFSSGIMHINCNKLFDMTIIRGNSLRYKTYPVNEDFIFIMEYLLHSSSISLIPNVLYHWVRIIGNPTAVESIPTNILQIYEHSHTSLATYLRNDRIAAKIAYRSYELIIFKFLQQYKDGRISSEYCFSSLSSFHRSELVKLAFDSYSPTAPFEKILYYVNKKGLFRITYACMQLLSVFK